MVTAREKVLVPVAPVEVLIVPVTELVPEIVIAIFFIVKVVPVPTDKLPVEVNDAPLGVQVTVPERVVLLLTVVTAQVTVPDPEKVRL